MRLREKPDIEMMFQQARITLNLDKSNVDEIVNFFGKLKPGVDYDMAAKERARRSLNANNYHWSLVNKLAEAMGVSNYEIHNQLLIDYGEDWLDEGLQPTFILMKDDDRYRKSETVHYRPTEHVENRNGVMYRWFILLLPSHLMDKRQMSRLLQGTISEAEQVGISVRSDEEIKRMVERWGR